MTIKKQKAPQKKVAVAVKLPKAGKAAGMGMGLSRVGNLGKYAHAPKAKG